MTAGQWTYPYTTHVFSTMILRVNVSFVVLVLPFILSQFSFALPVAKCRLCKECEENLNSTRKLTTTTRVNQTDLSDRNETDELM